MLLATALGWRDRHTRVYGRTVLRMTRAEVIAGLRAVKNRAGASAKARGLGGALTRSVVDLAGTSAGVVAAVGATLALRRRGPAE